LYTNNLLLLIKIIKKNHFVLYKKCSNRAEPESITPTTLAAIPTTTTSKGKIDILNLTREDRG
jgi:hypothetical protein